MRFMPALYSVILATALSGCAGLQLSMSTTDPAKLAALGKGAPVAAVDKALGLTKPLWTHTADTDGTPYHFYVYDWVESAYIKSRNRVCEGMKCFTYNEPGFNMAPYAIIYAGKEPRMHAWGPISQLRKGDDPIVLGMLPELTKQYDAFMAQNK